LAWGIDCLALLPPIHVLPLLEGGKSITSATTQKDFRSKAMAKLSSKRKSLCHLFP
jgi:hypothetical protein